MARTFSLVLDENPLFKFGVTIGKLNIAVLENYGKL